MASVGSSARKELDKKKKKKSEIRRSSGRATGPMMDHSDGQKEKNKMRKRERVGRTDGANIKRRE